MSHLLSHHSIKRAEETSFHWNINLLKIVCNTTEQKKILTFYIHVYPQLFLFDIVSFVCGAGRGCCWWFDDSEMFGFHRLGFHCSFMFNVCFNTPLQSLKLNKNIMMFRVIIYSVGSLFYVCIWFLDSPILYQIARLKNCDHWILILISHRSQLS